jgi:hypothetical protein
MDFEITTVFPPQLHGLKELAVVMLIKLQQKNH